MAQDLYIGVHSKLSIKAGALIHHQGIVCGVAFDLSSLRRISRYASVVAPRRLTSDTFLVIRNPLLASNFGEDNRIRW